jgi:hypothetical protein
MAASLHVSGGPHASVRLSTHESDWANRQLPLGARSSTGGSVGGQIRLRARSPMALATGGAALSPGAPATVAPVPRALDRLPVPSRSDATTLLYGSAVAGVIALHLATNGTLGFHTDDLYYIDAGRHPAFGYVDFPPIVPVLARLETDLLGTSPWKLRILPTLLGGLMVALSGAYVRRLGGSLRLQAIALLIAMAAPYFLGANWVFQTVTFDELIWMVALYWFLALVITGRPRYWVYLGITLGIGLQVKYTIVGLIMGIYLSVLVTPSLRHALRSRYPWIAAALALLIWSPNLAWQIAEGFPSLEYASNHRGSGGGPLIYVIEIVVYLFFLLPLWIAGLVSLFRSRSLRPIGIACALPLILFLLVGKSYYAVGDRSNHPGPRAHGYLPRQTPKAALRLSDRGRCCRCG